MIEINKKEDCVGCNACVQRCPKQCIYMFEDDQGFLYPKVDISTCIECGLCEKVCPVINQSEPKTPENVYAAWNSDDKIRTTSSSGGIFYALAKKTIDERGVVFGARFNEKWEVVHGYNETLDGIKAFQGSKYVQSRIGQSYLEAERFLKSGRKVLFTGTPCQIAGLKRFLRKDYSDLLLTVEVVCHGVPSPRIWKEYLNHIMRPKGASKNTESQPYPISVDDMHSIEGISFRDKRFGWEKFGIAIRFAPPKGGRNSESQSTISKGNKNSELFESHRENLFMQGFLKNLYLRPPCYECPAKCGKSNSDITLADFWGIKNHHPELFSDEGVSLVFANTINSIHLLKDLNIELRKVSYSEALVGNSAIIHSVPKPKLYSNFWKLYSKQGFGAVSDILPQMRPSIYLNFRSKLIKIISHIIGDNKIIKIKQLMNCIK